MAENNDERFEEVLKEITNVRTNAIGAGYKPREVDDALMPAREHLKNKEYDSALEKVGEVKKGYEN